MEKVPVFTIYDWLRSQEGVVKTLNAQFEVESQTPHNFKRVPYEDHQLLGAYSRDNVVRYFSWDWKTHSVVMYQENPITKHDDFTGLEFYHYTVQGEPVMTYKGKKLRGYGEISKAIYGTHVEDIDRRIAHLLTVDDFEPEKLMVMDEIKQGSYEYTLYKYDGNQEIKGKAGLKRRFPNTDPKKFDRTFPLYQKRHLYLIDKYQIQRFGKDYILGLGKIFTSQKSVIDHLKNEHNETVSSHTRLEIFKNIKDFDLNKLVEYHSLTYNRDTRTCDFISKDNFYPDQKIEQFLEVLPFEPYDGMRDDLIKILS